MKSINSEKMETSIQLECPACSSEGDISCIDIQDYFFGSPGNWSTRKCFNCKTIWLDPAPLPQEIGKAYLNYHTHLNATKETGKMRRKIYEKYVYFMFIFSHYNNKLNSEKNDYRHLFLKNHSKGKLLDIGCGGGRFLRRMQRHGWEVEGIDSDPKATERVSKKYGIKTYNGDVRELSIAHESYDVIVMSHAIEHVIEPLSVLVECKKLLKPGGQLILITPNADSIAHRRFGKYWRGLEIPRHIQVFTRNGLDSCLERAGFSIKKVTTFSHHSEGIYRVSKEMRHKILQIPYNYLNSIIKSKIYALAEYRYSNRNPNIGEDVLAIAFKDHTGNRLRASESP